MSQFPVGNTAQGSFRSQWAQLCRTSPADTQRFQESVAPWMSADTIEMFARLIPDARPVATPIKPQFLAQLARRFHRRAGTLTAGVERCINDYASGNRPSVRVAHQPNFLPSVNVAGQAVVCASLADSMPGHPVQVFLVIDYDVNTDRRYRHATLPSISSHLGYHSISTPLEKRYKDTLIFGEPKPTSDDLNQILDLLHTYTANDHFYIRQKIAYSRHSRHDIAQHEAEIREHLEISFNYGRTLAEANAIFLSRFVNLILGIPTIFVPGSEALEGLKDHIKYLWSMSGKYYEACDKVAKELRNIGINISASLIPEPHAAPFWIPCDKDFSRIRMHWTDQRSRTKARGTCIRCKSTVDVTLKSLDSFSSNVSRAMLIPRVVWDDLLDGFAWGHRAGCSYRGGLEHYLFTAGVAAEMGLPALPEFLSEYKARGPLNEFEHAAELLCKEAGRKQRSDPQPGERNPLNVARSGQASVAYPMVWKPLNTIADDLKRGFAGDLKQKLAGSSL